MQTGIHLIGDLHNCNFSLDLASQDRIEKLKTIISEKIREVELTELGNFYHFFGLYSVTAVICLAESHISFHTWGEEKYTSLDVFVCNYQKDNTDKAHLIFNYLISELFKPEKVTRKEIKR